jgi:hypothetical protein
LDTPWFVEVNSVPGNPVNHVCTGIFAAVTALCGRPVPINAGGAKKVMRHCLKKMELELGIDDQNRPKRKRPAPKSNYTDNKAMGDAVGSWLLGRQATHHEADAICCAIRGLLFETRPLGLVVISNAATRTLACSEREIETLL